MRSLKNKTKKILIWSQKYTKTDMVYFTKNGSWVFLESVILALISLVLIVAYANFLTKEVFGIYKFVLSFAGIAAALSLTELATAITRAVAKGYDKSVIQGRNMSLKWSFGTVLISTSAAIYYYLNDDITLSISMLIIGAAAPIIQSFGLYSSLLVGKKEIKNKVIFSVIQNLLSASLIILTIVSSDSLLILIFIFFFTQVILNIIYYYLTLNRLRPSTEASSETFSFGKHLSFMSILAKVANSAEHVLAFHFLGAGGLATYVFALALPKRIKGMFFSLNTIILPKLSARTIPEIKSTMSRKVLLFFFVLLTVTLIYIILAPYIFEFLFPQYVGAVKYSQVSALTIIFTFTMPLRQTLLAHAKKRSLYISQITIPALKIILTLILLPIYGIWGGIAALLITRLYNSLLYIYLFYRL